MTLKGSKCPLLKTKWEDVSPTHLEEEGHYEERSGLGEICEYRRKPDPKPVPFPPQTFVECMHCVPLSFVTPGK